MGDDLIDREAALAILAPAANSRDGLWSRRREKIAAAIRALPSATQAGGWMPPEDREDGYRCLGFETLWSTVEWREGYWLALTENDDRLLVTPIAFAPLPPAPEGGE